MVNIGKEANKVVIVKGNTGIPQFQSLLSSTNTGPAMASLTNDLASAVEFQEEGVWHVLYPGRKVDLAAEEGEVLVRLRDANHMVGRCSKSKTLHVSIDFKELGLEVRRREASEKHEADRLAQRKAMRQRQLEAAVRHDALEESGTSSPQETAFWMMLLAFPVMSLIGFTAAFDLEQVEDDSLTAFVVVCGITVLGVSYLMGWLCRQTVKGWFNGGASFAFGRRAPYVIWSYWLSSVLAVLCLIVLTVRWCAVVWWAAFFFWPSVIWWSARALQTCWSPKREDWMEDRDWRRVWQKAHRRVLDRSIVFEGRVLEGRETCVCSWPGKYEEAWDTMVAASLLGDVSAAVVFLPEGTTHFGIHDQIPEEEGLEGACWCTPLYGERKAWGCRWWTHWIANIEAAVKLGQTLEVYFFQGMVGQGKVRSFETAGGEHWNRDELYKKKKDFEKSDAFLSAVNAGLRGLSCRQGADGTSPYSREVQRLFLDWLPQDEAATLKASEGLGNSQKAEVAWLERKGYSYTERDVAVWLSADAGEVSIQAAAEPTAKPKAHQQKFAWGSPPPAQ